MIYIYEVYKNQRVEIVFYYEKKKLDRLNKKIFDVCIKIIYADINYS